MPDVYRTEHPRPDFMREAWVNLNGTWDFCFDPYGVGIKENWPCRTALSGNINVPFCIESELSGVSRRNPPRIAWYLRRFLLPEQMRGQRVFLHFGAVDYAAGCWLNGQSLGSHQGGYTPFDFEITEHLLPGENCLAVRVEDSFSLKQVRGKQSFYKKNIAVHYKPVTGIWQTVWLEGAGRALLRRVLITPKLNASEVSFNPEMDGACGDETLQIKIFDPAGRACGGVAVQGEALYSPVIVALDQVFPWSPVKPDLYHVLYTLSAGGELLDRVESYFGLRDISIAENKVYLNGAPLYQKLLLNQGYYPQGHYTASDDQAMRRDLEMVKEMGFNGVRVHQKVEDKRFLYWCDILGVLVWCEMPSFYWPSRKAREAFLREWRELLLRDYNHPAIITWVPFNESWGIFNLFWSKNTRRFVREVVAFTRAFDPSRPVVDNSGCDHIDTDIADVHHYLSTVEKSKRLYSELRRGKRMKYGLFSYLFNLVLGTAAIIKRLMAPGSAYQGQPVLISEYGGFGFYRTQGGKSLAENFREYTEAIQDEDWICGYCYTQQYDLEHEKNGLLTFNREYKIPPEKVASVNNKK